MNIIFRVDASSTCGLGHLMRCQTLAHELNLLGARCYFLINQYDLDLKSMLDCQALEYEFITDEVAAISSIKLQASIYPLLVIVDNYQLGQKWHQQVRDLNTYIMAIDDLANRPFDVDLLLDQNLVLNYQTRYQRLLPESSATLLGVKYALLRREFFDYRQQLESFEQRLNALDILINFGGSDPHNETLKALQGALSLEQVTKVTVIVGEAYQHLEELKLWIAKRSEVILLQNVKDMARYMSKALVMIGAVGTTTWERCSLGIIGLVSTIAENQLATANYLQQLGAHYYLGRDHDLTVRDYCRGLEHILSSPEMMKSIHERSISLVDGLGARRVAGYIQTFLMVKHASS